MAAVKQQHGVGRRRAEGGWERIGDANGGFDAASCAVPSPTPPVKGGTHMPTSTARPLPPGQPGAYSYHLGHNPQSTIQHHRLLRTLLASGDVRPGDLRRCSTIGPGGDLTPNICLPLQATTALSVSSTASRFSTSASIASPLRWRPLVPNSQLCNLTDRTAMLLSDFVAFP